MARIAREVQKEREREREKHRKSKREENKRKRVQEASDERGRKIYRKARVGETDNTPSRWVAYLRVHGVAPGVQ